MNRTVDVAIIGAGPYGLSIAAHLRGSGLSVRQFGIPMNQWATHMPRGMFLKSQGFASNLSDPDGSLTLKNFCAATAREYGDYGVPVPIDTFIAYGRAFQKEFAPGLEEVLVTRVESDPQGYRLELADGQELAARNVVVAAGVEHFPYVPDVLADLPSDRCTHPSEHADLAGFAGRKVTVIGAGQSALESAALLHEGGADVTLVCRADTVRWNGPPLAPTRPWWQRVREPEVGLGSGVGTWFYSTQPKLYHRLPEKTRVTKARTALGPAGGCWLRERVEHRFPILTGHAVDLAKADGDGVLLTLRTRHGSTVDLATDHVLAGTGYPPVLDRLTFLDRALRDRLPTVNATPEVGANFESGSRGLYFVGTAVAPSFGPVMRFVYGADFAAHTVAASLTRNPVTRPVPAGVSG